MALCCSTLTISDCEAAQRWGCYAPSADRTSGSSCHECNRDSPPDQCAHSAETQFTVTSVIRPHRNRSPRHSKSWRGRRRSRIVWERSLGLSLLPHHSGYDRKEERDHQQPQEITDDHPPRRENAKILGQSSYPHDAPPRKVVPCSNDPRGTSFPTKIMERRDQQPETLFDPSLLSLPQMYGGDFRVFLDPNSISHAIRRAWQAEIFRFHLAGRADARSTRRRIGKPA